MAIRLLCSCLRLFLVSSVSFVNAHLWAAVYWPCQLLTQTAGHRAPSKGRGGRAGQGEGRDDQQPPHSTQQGSKGTNSFLQCPHLPHTASPPGPAFPGDCPAHLPCTLRSSLRPWHACHPARALTAHSGRHCTPAQLLPQAPFPAKSGCTRSPLSLGRLYLVV